jgi:hypothetical protein
MRNYALFAALALVLGAGAVLADHAVEPETRGNHAIEADQATETDQAVQTEQTDRTVKSEQVVEAVRTVEADASDSEPAVYGITREVCTVSDWGLGEVRRECVTEVLPPREPNPALEGICMIKYGVRSCY